MAKVPNILALDVAGPITQTKVRFITQVMERPLIAALRTNAPLLTYGLATRIGPRWAFHQLYTTDTAFLMNSHIKRTDENFLKYLVSPSLDAECALHNIDRLQLFEEFIVKWQQGEGKILVIKKAKRSAKVARRLIQEGAPHANSLLDE